MSGPQQDDAKLVLYGQARAPYTEKVRRALVLKGLSYELREPQGPEDYARWSPETGLLPVLEVAGERIADSTEILLRLEQRFPRPPLLAADPRTQAQQRQLEDWADESFLFYFQRWIRMNQERESRREGAARAGALRRLRGVGAWLRAGGTWERPHTALLRQLGDRMDDLVNFLGARAFFYADAVSMADLAVYGMLFTLRSDAIPGSQRLLAERPALVDYMRRVEVETGG